MSEIEPGHRYELVCTTTAGLVRYRMGDIINCTQFLCRADDLVPLPEEPVEIPRIPLISLSYRAANLLNVIAEKTTEQHVMYALQQTIQKWKGQGIEIDLCDFTSYSKLDEFPPKYVIFLELIEEKGYKLDLQQLRFVQNTVSSEVEEHLCKANGIYHHFRNAKSLDPLSCILVRTGTFSTYLTNVLLTDRVSPLQVKPHRLLKDNIHIRFFYDNQIDTESS
ncbi:unnamed protein product [Rotaria sp. Silwood2]|nr:unnamed protein product [Rotaria sp. Silwood2]CAF4057791.1 unnamed protein product [Rotaria sp. Silwood2]